MDCVPVCLKMAIDYMQLYRDARIPSMSVDDIAQEIKTTVLGTVLSEVPNINKKLCAAGSDWEVSVSEHGKFEMIFDDLRNGLPCVVFYDLRYDIERIEGREKHACVVRGHDPKRRILFCNDPIRGEIEIPETRFRYLWYLGAFSIIRWSRAKRPDLTRWIQQNINERQQYKE